MKARLSNPILLSICVLSALTPLSHGANILYYLGVSSYSQHTLVMPFLETLAAAGHNVTMFSPHPNTNSSSRVIEFTSPGLHEFVTNFGQSDIINLRMTNHHRDSWAGLGDAAVTYCHMWLSNPETIQWVKSSHFDLVIKDALWSECALGLTYVWKAPYIDFSTMPVAMWHHDAYGVPSESSSIPDLQYGFPLEMSFLQRAWTTIRIVYWHFYRRVVHFPETENTLRKYLEIPDMPSIDVLQRNPSLVFINHHYSVDYSKSMPPLFVSVSGIHVYDKKVNPLPEKMTEFLKRCGETGFIYFTFGTFAQLNKISDDLKFIFLQTFEKFPDVCFLVKWEGLPPPNVGKNIYFQKWMPQQDILAHSKIRAFITHGGLLGIQEAVYFNVPLIVCPLFAEQDYNAEKIIRVGYGIKLEVTTLKANDLEFAIREMLTNSKYKEKMSQVSALFRDRPDKPLETAVWWTEFVLRHKNVSSMLVPYAAQQTWYQRRLLDVWALVAIIFLLLFFTIWRVSQLLLILVFKKSHTNAKSGNQKPSIEKKRK